MRIPAIKKSIYIFSAIVAILAVIVFLTPHMLDVKVIKDKVADRLRHDLRGDVVIGAIHLHWLPTPHVAVTDLSVDNDMFTASLPGVDLYPDWFSLLPWRESALQFIELSHPQVNLKKIGAAGAAPKLPSLTVKIQDGSLTTPAIDTGGAVNVPAISVSSINSRVKIDPRFVSLRFSGSAPFVEKIEMKGRFDLSSLKYDAEVECLGLVIRKGSIQKAGAGGDFTTGDSVLSLRWNIKGQGTNSFSSDIIGDMPCLLYQAEGGETPINCGFGEFSIKKDGRALSLEIKDLEILEPGLSLSGIVSRTPADGALDKWHIDLAAKKLNLTAIRSGLLNIFPTDKIVALVCDIVRGGTAESGSFRFDGPLADLAHLHLMTIEADVKSAEIHVPHVGLDLHNASGPIEIKDGILTGQGLSAELGNSVGSNGVLKVGLAPHHFHLELGLDIDADLADIDKTLRQIVPGESFQHELTRFSNPQGKASGHLSLGEHQHHIDVAVAVREMSGTFLYDRVPWPIKVLGGKLKVDTKNGVVLWQDVSAETGRQRINGSNGSVHWKEKPVVLSIDNIVADLDAGEIYKGLDLHPALLDHLKPVISGATGALKLGNGSSLTGPFFDPSQWRYSLMLTGKDLVWRSPLLPDEVSTRTVTAVLGDSTCRVAESDNYIGLRPIVLRADLQHHLYRNWSGNIDIAGEIGEQTGRWIKEKGWLPLSLQPQIPARLERLHINWGHGDLALSGKMLAGLKGVSQPSMIFDVQSRRDNPLLLELAFVNGMEKGHFTLDMLDRKPETFSVKWEGSLSSATAGLLMADKELLNGELQGDFKITLPENPLESRFEGWLRADNFSWYLGEKSGLLKFPTLRFQGNGSELIVKEIGIDFGYGESFVSHGKITPDENGLMLDLNVLSPLFSMATINAFLADLRTHQAKQIDECGGGAAGWSMIGAINFHVDDLKTVRGKDTVDSTSKALHWRPVSGRIELSPDEKTSIKIDTANLCCVGFSGEWNSPQINKVSSFQFSTQCDPLPLMQDVLPCLGIDQDVIEGDFRIDGNVQGVPGDWRSGKLAIHSNHGRILRMTMLSRIFTVVNLTDLFVSDGLPDMEKEGFSYSSLDFEAEIKNNKLVIDRAVIKGKGLNLFARGELDLVKFTTDFTVLIAPFKTIDAIISSIPLLGRVIGGKYATLVTIPVKVTGSFHDPSVVPLAPSAISEGMLNIVKEVFMMPYTIISPFLPDEEKKQEEPSPAMPPDDPR